jgi:predicted GIY-YIG superfamily endonuclease
MPRRAARAPTRRSAPSYGRKLSLNRGGGVAKSTASATHAGTRAPAASRSSTSARRSIQSKARTVAPGKHVVYTTKNRGGHTYVGSTSNLQRRMQEHTTGWGSTLSRKRAPTSLSTVREYPSQAAALAAEERTVTAMRKQAGSKSYMVHGGAHTKSTHLKQWRGAP